jgi:2-iminobutanoate/2-iminopropanoate deaminase
MDTHSPATPSDASERRWHPVTLGADVPPPAGAYSPGVRAGDLLFVSGQVPKDPRTGAIVGQDVAEQTRQVLRNVRGVLEAAGATLADVVSVTVYLEDEGDWGTFNEIYKSVFSPPYPSRAVVGARLRGILVEVSAVAYLGEGSR